MVLGQERALKHSRGFAPVIVHSLNEDWGRGSHSHLAQSIVEIGLELARGLVVVFTARHGHSSFKLILTGCDTMGGLGSSGSGKLAAIGSRGSGSSPSSFFSSSRGSSGSLDTGVDGGSWDLMRDGLSGGRLRGSASNRARAASSRARCS